MKKILILFLVVLVAGCIQTRPVKVDANNGIRIEAFSVDPLDVYDRNTVSFDLDIENVGGNTARNIDVELIGIGVWGLAGYTQPARIRTMRPPNLENDIPGDMQIISFGIVDAPDLPEGDIVSFPVKARVTYDYSTGSTTVIKAVSYDYYRTLQNKGETVENALSMRDAVNGPIQIKLVKGATPMIVDPEEAEPGYRIEKTYRFEIQNVGDGWPITDNDVGKVTGSIEVIGSGFILKSCSGIIGTPNSFYTILRSDGSAPISCIVEVDPVGWERKTEVVFLFKSSFNFRYYVEEEKSVTVRGTRLGTSSGSSIPGSSVTDTKAPMMNIVSPAESSWQSSDFYVEISDYDMDSGLGVCEYKVTSKGAETVGWTPRTCNTRLQITVGPNKNCRDEGIDTCMLFAGTRDKAGNTVRNSRAFSIDWV